MPPSEPTANEPTPALPPVAADVPPVPAEVAIPVARPVAKPVADQRDYDHVYQSDEEWDDFRFDDGPPTRRRPPRLAKFVRVMLILMAVFFAAIIGVALWLDPYERGEDGTATAKTMETHRQMGLPRCNSVEYLGKPCPACGMTTSFALLAHADVVNSFKANWVGTLLCATIMLCTPWLVISAIRGRLLWVRNGEMFATIILSSLLVLMMGRWAWIMFVN